MKIATTLSLLLAPAAAFVLRSPKTSTCSTTTALNNGMDAYDAQMKALLVAQQQSQMTLPVSSSSIAAATADTALFTPGKKDSQRWRKKTKQLATLGPASSTLEMIEALFLAGADVFRLNFSHGEHAQKKQLLDIIRQVEHKYDHPIGILGDLQGPKLRVGQFANPDGENLTKGQEFRDPYNAVLFMSSQQAF